MKICILSKMFPPGGGGAETYAYELANSLGIQGHDVDVFTQSDGNAEQLEYSGNSIDIQDNVEVYTLTKSRKYLVTIETMLFSISARLNIELEKYDVIHGTLLPASTIAISPFSNLDTPIVLTCHSFAPAETKYHTTESPADYLLRYFFHPQNIAMDALAARGADQVIAITSQMAQQLIESYHLNDSQVRIVSHGVNVDKFQPKEERHRSVCDDKFTFLIVGRLITRKRIDFAIRAIAKTNRSDIELIIAGTGRDRKRLEKLAIELDISDQVKFLGYVPEEELPTLYSSSDAKLFTASYEGFGLTILESMAAGTPVIGTLAGGVPDIIDDGHNGYIVDGNVDSLSEKISYLTNNSYELDGVSVRARECAKTLSWNNVAEKIEKIYLNLD